MNPLTERALARLIFLLAVIAGRLPMRAGTRLGKALGRGLYRWDGRHRQIALDNLRKAYAGEKGAAEIEAIGRRVFENLGRVIFEVCWFVSHDEETQTAHVRIEGRSNIEDAYNRGRGVLTLTAHFGNWELLTVVGAILGYPSSIVYRPLDFGPMEHLTVRLRTRFGASVIPKQRAFRGILRSLRRGDLVALLMDQNVSWYEGVFADFFGRPACTNKGMALLALKTEAPVVPVFMVRNPSGSGFTARFLPALPLIKTGDRIRDIEANTAQYNRVIESMVREYPDQWFWVHRRWNTRPYCPWP